jgi:hypothetical protein
MDVIIENERDRRVLDWLIAKVGEQGVRDAIARIPGKRRSYVSNVVKALGLKVPPEVVDPPVSMEEALKRLAEIRQMMR